MICKTGNKKIIRRTAICHWYYVRTLQTKCNNIKLKETWNISYWQKPNFSVL